MTPAARALLMPTPQPDAYTHANRDKKLRGKDRQVLWELTVLWARHPDDEWHPLHVWIVANRLKVCRQVVGRSLRRLISMGYLELAGTLYPRRRTGRKGRLVTPPACIAEQAPARVAGRRRSA